MSPPHLDSLAPFWCQVNRVFPTLEPLVEAVCGLPTRTPMPTAGGHKLHRFQPLPPPELWSRPPVNVQVSG